MSRHERDAVSLMGGLLLVLLAVGLLVEDLTGLRLDPGLTAAAALVVVGLAGLGASVRSSGTATDTGTPTGTHTATHTATDTASDT